MADAKAVLFEDGKFQAVGNNGQVVPYGKLYFYDAVSGDKVDTYTTSTTQTKNAWPVILSASGKADVYVTDGQFNVNLRDKNDTTVWTINDFIPAGGDTALAPTVIIPTKEEFVGVTGTTIDLAGTPVSTVDVHKNGLLLNTDEYSLSGRTITFTVALIVTDEIVVDFSKIVANDGNDGVLYTISIMEDILTLDVSYSNVNVKGYYVENDDGAGLFNYDNSIDKSTANGGTIIDPGVSLTLQGTGTGFGCWIRQYSGAINIKWFGAKGDGATEDTTVIQAAITLAIASGNSLFFPASVGSYLVKPLVFDTASGIVVFGEKTTELELIYFAYGADSSIFQILNSDSITIRNLSFIGTSDTVELYDVANRYSGINIQTSSFVTIEDCIFTKFSSYAIFGKDLTGGTYTEGLKILNNIFRDSPYDSLTPFQAGIILSSDAEYSIVKGNSFFRIPSAIRFTDGANSMFVENIVMKLNGGDDTLQTDRACIYAESNSNSGKITISDNKINHNETGQIVMILKGDTIKPRNAFIVSNNDMLVNGATNFNHQIVLYDAPNSRIIGNQLRPSLNTQALIRLNDSPNVVVSNNYLNGGTYGIETTAGVKVVATDNIFDNQATSKLSATNVRTANKNTFIARVSSAGVYGIPNEHTNEGWTVSNIVTGKFSIAHDIGNTNFSVTVTSDNNNIADTVFSVVRAATTLDIFCKQAGVLTDVDILVEIELPADNEYIF